MVGNNLNLFGARIRDASVYFIELKVTYRMALIFNFLIIFITFGFIFYKDFLLSTNFFETPVFVDDSTFSIDISKYFGSFDNMNSYLSEINPCLYDYSFIGSNINTVADPTFKGYVMPERDYCNPRYTDPASVALCEISNQKARLMHRALLHLEYKDGRYVFIPMTLPSKDPSDYYMEEAKLRVASHFLNDKTYYPNQLYAFAMLGRR